MFDADVFRRHAAKHNSLYSVCDEGLEPLKDLPADAEWNLCISFLKCADAVYHKKLCCRKEAARALCLSVFSFNISTAQFFYY